jgi:cytochrome P450
MKANSFPRAQSLSPMRGKSIEHNHLLEKCLTICRAILHDNSVYGDDTDDFRPERFMKGNKLNPEFPQPGAAFGFGRRICAGRDMAEASIWITMTSLLAAFNFKGKEGYKENDYGLYTDGLVS